MRFIFLSQIGTTMNWIYFYFILLGLIILPENAYASEPGIFDVLFGIMMIFFITIVLPITLIGLALRKKTPTEKATTSVTEQVQISVVSCSNGIEEPQVTSTKTTAQIPLKKYTLICVAIFLFLSLFAAKVPFLRYLYENIFESIMFSFPILVILVIALISLIQFKNKKQG